MGGLLARFHCNVKRRSVEESSKNRSSKIDENPNNREKNFLSQNSTSSGARTLDAPGSNLGVPKITTSFKFN